MWNPVGDDLASGGTPELTLADPPGAFDNYGRETP